MITPVRLIAAMALVGFVTDADGQGRRGSIDRVEHQATEMVLVPAGTFTMGLDKSESEMLEGACALELGPQRAHCTQINASGFALGFVTLKGTVFIGAREVFLDAFEIDRHEVTAGKYRACVAAGRCALAPLVVSNAQVVADPLPIVNVTWHEARDYCRWRGKRLPTEAEWEKAARGTQGQLWPWGNHDRADGSNHGGVEADAIVYGRLYDGARGKIDWRRPTLLAPNDKDGATYALRPGGMRWSEGPYGTYDQAGNVAEWVADYFDRRGYEGLPLINPVRDVGAEGERMRSVRGGSWMEPRFYGRTYFRAAALPEQRSAYRGFRCARSPKR